MPDSHVFHEMNDRKTIQAATRAGVSAYAVGKLTGARV